ncbi:MAG: 1-phosphofructokinase [Candidatus Omnitrophota bacterium]
MKIYTLTANPCLDIFLEVPRLVSEDINRVTAVRKDAGGKGINVIRVLKILGIKGLALGIIGGESGSWIENRLKKEEIRSHFFPIPGEIRTIYNIKQTGTNQTFRLNEPGPRITSKTLLRFQRFLLSFPYPKGSFFAICGTAPPGIPVDFYGHLIDRLKKRGIKTVLDCDDPFLSKGIDANPEIIKPNLFELSRLVKKRLKNEEEILNAAFQFVQKGIKLVVVSMAANGALAVTEKEAFYAQPPPVKVRSPIGAGDAFLAGLLAKLAQKENLSEALRTAVAAGSASVLYPGTSCGSLADINTIYRKVKVRKLSPSRGIR